MKVLLQSQLCLVLLIRLFGKAQQVTANNNLTCNERQYKPDSLDKCCSRCPPGTYAIECTETTDTQCLPCDDGEYTSSWNYASKCKKCKSCDAPFVEKEKCSSTRKEQCVCPEGFKCQQYNGVGICMLCMPIPFPTTSPPTTSPPTVVPLLPEPSVMQITPDNPLVFSIITAAVVTACFIAIVILIVLAVRRHNTNILEKFGCMTKITKPQPESTGVPPSTTQALLENNLPYPIEETSATQSAEYALNSTRQNPV